MTNLQMRTIVRGFIRLTMIIYRFSICKCKESFDKCKEKQEIFIEKR